MLRVKISLSHPDPYVRWHVLRTVVLCAQNTEAP
jgi:hypothetical protein